MYRLNSKLHCSISKHHTVAFFKVCLKVFILNRQSIRLNRIFGHKNAQLAFFQFHTLIREYPQTDLRSAQVLKNCHTGFLLRSYGADEVNHFPVAFVIPVGKVQTGYIKPCVNKIGDCLRI